MDLKEMMERGADYFLPHLSIDLIIIGYQEEKLKCLLLKVGEKWILPGGYIRRDESVDHSVKRVLKERTGLEEPHLTFLSVFGDENRQFSAEFKHAFEKMGLDWKSDYWLNNRFVTLAYYSLVNIAITHPSVGEWDEAFDWFSFDELPEIWMDHKSLVMEARDRLKEEVRQKPVSYHLLSEHFTMPELHKLHETILEEELDRSRFQKKMLALGMFERLPKLQKQTPGRNPYQYTVKNELK